MSQHPHASIQRKGTLENIRIGFKHNSLVQTSLGTVIGVLWSTFAETVTADQD